MIARRRALADPRAVAEWARINISPEQHLGVNPARFKQLVKEIMKHHDLALHAWATGSHDARLLATMIDEPGKVTADQIAAEQEQIVSIELADTYCSNVVARTSRMQTRFNDRIDGDNELRQRGARMLIMARATSDPALPSAYFAWLLKQVERKIADEQNRARQAMNDALIAIGGPNAALRRAAIAARRGGPVVIGSGDTSRPAPNARANRSPASPQPA